MSKALKIILVIAGTLTAVFAAAAILAVIFFPADRVRGLIEEQGSDALDMPVRISDIGLSFRGIPSVRITGLTIGPAREGEPELVTLDAVDVRVALMKLLRREVEIVSLSLDRPVITMLTRDDGSTNLPGGAVPPPNQVPAAGPPQLPIPVTLRSFTIDSGRVELVNRADTTRIVLAGISSEMNLAVTRDLTDFTSSGETRVDSLLFEQPTGATRGVSVTFDHELSGDIAAGSVALTGGVLGVNGVPILVTGEVEHWTMYSFRAETGDVGFETALAAAPAGIIPEQERITADGTFSLAVSGSLDTTQPEPRPDFSGSLAFNGTGIGYDGLPGSIDEISGRATFTQSRIELGESRVRIGGSTLTASATISDYTTEAPIVSLRSSGSIDLDDVTAAVPMPEGITASGSVEYDISLDGTPANMTTFAASGTMTLNGLNATVPELLRHPAEVNARLTLTPESLAIDAMNFQSGTSDVTFTGSLGRYMVLAGMAEGTARMEGTLTSSLLDMNDLLVTPEAQPAEATKPWDLEQTVTQLPIPPGVTAELIVEMGRVLFGRLRAESVTGRLLLENGTVRLTGLDVAAYSGTLTGNTTVDFTDIGNVTYEGNCSLKNLDSSRFIADFFGVDEIVSGALSSSLTFSGAGLDSVSMLDNLVAHGDMSFAEGSIHNWGFVRELGEHISFLDFDTIDFDSITNTFRVEDRTLYTPDMAIAASFGDVEANGSVGFDTAVDYDIILILDEASSQRALQSFSDLASLFTGDTGRLRFTVGATGTLTSPSFKLDTSEARTQLQGRMADQVREKANELLDKQGEDIREKGKELLDKLFR